MWSTFFKSQPNDSLMVVLHSVEDASSDKNSPKSNMNAREGFSRYHRVAKEPVGLWPESLAEVRMRRSDAVPKILKLGRAEVL